MTMSDWEALYRALVRRLVEINDDADMMPTDRRILDYDVLARAHKKTMELYPDDRMIAGVVSGMIAGVDMSSGG